ncbi:MULTISPECIES: ABC transporter ATP-binding protein [unclassified Nocardiopsis]|uniref:ABC transporter ATP-binding protein n=1 Tax=Nocardiopsis TaxID=2013 RepID=UPI00387B02AD
MSRPSPAPSPADAGTPDPPAPVLALSGVTRVHGEDARRVSALVDADLVLHPGEFVAVMGPSGSGKSTLLHLAGGLDAPTSGRVLVQGTDLGTLSAADRAVVRRRSVGYVFQDFNLLPALTAAENVAFPLELDGLAARRARRAALDALAEVGVAELADRRPEDMSGGQAQRVAIARALVGPRRLLLADEPTGALDSATGTAVLRLLRDRADAGAAVLMVTHEARFAAWADRTVFLRDGRIIDETGPSDADELLGGAR